ncbi:hypothetical protein Hdeb2414_s0006g00194871 [Helianthus debilis subsp. tardiflorus]
MSLSVKYLSPHSIYITSPTQHHRSITIKLPPARHHNRNVDAAVPPPPATSWWRRRYILHHPLTQALKSSPPLRRCFKFRHRLSKTYFSPKSLIPQRNSVSCCIKVFFFKSSLLNPRYSYHKASFISRLR